MICNSPCYGKFLYPTRNIESIRYEENFNIKRCRAKGRTCGSTIVMSQVYHLVTILYTSCAQASPIPFTQLVEVPYFLQVTWASGPDQHCPAYWTPNTKYPALFAACAHLWIALLSNLQLPSNFGMARIPSSWKHPRWKKLTAGNKGTAVFKEFALKLASLYIYRTAMRKVIDLPWQTDYVSFFYF